MREKLTLRDYLAKLVSEAFNIDKDGKRTRRNPQLANFLNEHHLDRVWNGTPVWRRKPCYYDRKAR